jgi:hypothetical protein
MADLFRLDKPAHRIHLREHLELAWSLVPDHLKHICLDHTRTNAINPIAPAMPAPDEPFDSRLCFPWAADWVRTAEVCSQIMVWRTIKDAPPVRVGFRGHGSYHASISENGGVAYRRPCRGRGAALRQFISPIHTTASSPMGSQAPTMSASIVVRGRLASCPAGTSPAHSVSASTRARSADRRPLPSLDHFMPTRALFPGCILGAHQCVP